MILEVSIQKCLHTPLVFATENSRMIAAQDLAIIPILKYTEMVEMAPHITHYTADKRMAQCSRSQDQEPTAQNLLAQQPTLNTQPTVLEQDTGTGEQTTHLVGFCFSPNFVHFGLCKHLADLKEQFCIETI